MEEGGTLSDLLRHLRGKLGLCVPHNRQVSDDRVRRVDLELLRLELRHLVWQLNLAAGNVLAWVGTARGVSWVWISSEPAAASPMPTDILLLHPLEVGSLIHIL